MADDNDMPTPTAPRPVGHVRHDDPSSIIDTGPAFHNPGFAPGKESEWMEIMQDSTLSRRPAYRGEVRPDTDQNRAPEANRRGNCPQG